MKTPSSTSSAKPELYTEILFGRLLMKQGLVQEEHVQECLLELEIQADQGLSPLPHLGELLLQRGYLSPQQVKESLSKHQTRVMRRKGSLSEQEELELPFQAAAAASEPENIYGRYVRVERLGAGAMAEVWKAWDIELHRWVALKVLKHHDPEDLARFEREAHTVAKLNHPNIAAVYGFGHHLGQHYIAMQFIEGATLQHFPKRDLKLLVTLVRDVALGVHHAHENGVLHRDIKPGNIMVEGRPRGDSHPSPSRRGTGGSTTRGTRVYIMDFGLAKDIASKSSLSEAGHVLGTPCYASPEQAQGRLDEIAAASDVYSLGATLYDLTCGSPPFESKDFFQLLKMIAEEEPRSVRQRRPEIDADLDTIIMKCLEKVPGTRYASALELAEELDRWLSDEPITARPPSRIYRLRRGIAKSNPLIAWGAAALMFVAALAALLITLPGRGPENAGQAQREALILLEGSRPALEEAERSLYRENADPADLVRRVDPAQRDIEEALRRAPDLPVAHFLLGRAWHLKGQDAEAERCWRKAARLDPGFGTARYELGRLLALRSLVGALEAGADSPPEPEAAAELEAALAERAKLSDPLRRKLAQALLAAAKGEFLRAIGLAREGAALFSGNEGGDEFSVVLGLLVPAGERNHAFSQAIGLRTSNPLAWYGRGLARSRNGDTAGAAEDFARALQVAPPGWERRTKVEEALRPKPPGR